MLHTNLSTRPFYNTRIVRVGLLAVAVIAAGLMIFNVVELWRLQTANRELGQTVTQNENQARDLRQKARTVTSCGSAAAVKRAACTICRMWAAAARRHANVNS